MWHVFFECFVEFFLGVWCLQAFRSHTVLLEIVPATPLLHAMPKAGNQFPILARLKSDADASNSGKSCKYSVGIDELVAFCSTTRYCSSQV